MGTISDMLTYLRKFFVNDELGSWELRSILKVSDVTCSWIREINSIVFFAFVWIDNV